MTTDTDNSTKLLTREEAARVLRVSPRTVSRYAASGLLQKLVGGPHGRCVRFRKSDVLLLEEELWNTDYTPAE